MDPALQEIIRWDLNPDDVIEAVIRLRDKRFFPEKIKLVTQQNEIITCRVRRGDIQEVYQSPKIVSFKAPRYIHSEANPLEWVMDTPLSPSLANLGESSLSSATGQGVVVGVVDWGFDFAHPNFRTLTGQTRLLALWDQAREGSGSPPSPYGYGRVYLPEEINSALQYPFPYRVLGYHPASGDPRGSGAHGTHVMDIAAGNGAKGRVGVAPEADLVFVHLASKETSPLTNLGDSVRILEAIDFISHIAGERPCVINLSVGRHGGHHRGVSLVEQGMDAFLESKKNRVICQSTGNYYMAGAHHSGWVRPGRAAQFEFLIDRGDKTANELEIWYPGEDEFLFELQSRQAPQIFRCSIKGRADIRYKGKIIGRVYHRAHEPNTGLNHINVFLYTEAPPGRWRVKLFGKKVSNGKYHAWIERDSSCRKCQSRFLKPYVDPSFTTGTICNGYHTIGVGAYDSHSPWFQLAPFSSKGPTTDRRIKPDLIAPGVRIVAARSSPRNWEIPSRLLTRMSGTSMAAPKVTGAVALMLQRIKKPIGIHQIKNILLGSTDSFPIAKQDELRFGNGILNIKKTLKNVEKYNRTYTRKNYLKQHKHEQNSNIRIG